LAKEVFDVGLTRVARQRDAIPRLQVTMNPADEDHWTYHEFVDDPLDVTIDDLYIKTRKFDIPYGENKYLTDMSRELVKVGYRDDPALYARYVKGEFSFVIIGEKVCPEYDENIHRTKVKLDPMDNQTFIRCWDGGLYPSCVIMQFAPSGKLRILDTVRGENIGLRQLIKTQLRPLFARRYYKWIDDLSQWRDIGDPNIGMREQSDSEQSAAGVITDELGGTFEPGPSHWHPRRESMKEAFYRMVDGEPMIQISKHEGILHRAVRGGWHYKKDNQGRIMGDKPVKDIHSHPGDAFSYGIGKLLPWKPRIKIDQKKRERYAKSMKSYGGKRK